MSTFTWSQPGARERGRRRRFGLGLRSSSHIPAAGWTRPADIKRAVSGRAPPAVRSEALGLEPGAAGALRRAAGPGGPAPRPGEAGPSPTPPSGLAAARAAAGSREPGDVPGG